jgi:hypothetical protein
MTGTPLGRDLAVKGRSRLCRCAKRRLEGESRPARTRTEAGRSIRTLTAAARPAPMDKAPRIPIPPGQRPITHPAPRPMPGIPPITRRCRGAALLGIRLQRMRGGGRCYRRRDRRYGRRCGCCPRSGPAHCLRGVAGCVYRPFRHKYDCGGLWLCITFRAHNRSGAGVDAGFVVHQ